MREYELSVIYDLSVAEGGGPQAAVERLQNTVTARGGEVVKVDHWGRRRLAYPIKTAIDGEYIITRVMLEPAAITALETALRIDERVYRHLLVRADELPPPAPPREPRAPRRVAEPEGGAPAATAEAPAAAAEAPVADAADAPAAEAPPAAPEAQAPAEPAAPAAEPEPEAPAQEEPAAQAE